MLVVVTIIGIIAGMAFGALQLARQSAHEQATKTTIAKLNNIILRQYDSYKTRRAPIKIRRDLTPKQAAILKLAAIRDLMRMEMPERWSDIADGPAPHPYLPLLHQLPLLLSDNVTVVPYTDSNGNIVTVGEPALRALYRTRYATTPPNNNYTHAKCLYLTVSMGSPEAMEQFHQSEIKVDTDGWPYFVDGWGRPIYFVRWAPGCSSYSEIQPADPTNSHDPFDTRNVDPGGYRLVPLIVSFGRDTNPAAYPNSTGGYGNLNMGPATGVTFYDGTTSTIPMSICDLTQYQSNGAPDPTYGAGTTGNIHNHHIEQK